MNNFFKEIKSTKEAVNRKERKGNNLTDVCSLISSFVLFFNKIKLLKWKEQDKIIKNLNKKHRNKRCLNCGL